jgi:cobalt/nickel transport system permease protein
VGLRLAGNARKGKLVAGFGAAWLSVFIVSLSVAMQLALSGTSPANLAIPAMASVHAIIGVGEGLITFGALAFLISTRPDLIQSGETRPAGGRLVWAAGLLIALILVIISPLASTNPDGLERVAMENGFMNKARESLFQIIPDYQLPGASNEVVATIAAGILGVAIVLLVTLGVAYARRNRQISGG